MLLGRTAPGGERSCQARKQPVKLALFKPTGETRWTEVDEECFFDLPESDGCLVALAVFKTVVGPFHGAR